MVEIPWHNIDDLAVVLFLGGLGLGIILANPRIRANRLLGIFLLLVAGNYGASFLADVASRGSTDTALASAGFAFGVLDPFVLAWFASSFPNRRGPFSHRIFFRVAAVETVLLAVAAAAWPGEFGYCCSPAFPPRAFYPAKLLLVAHVTAYYVAAFLLLWSSYRRERSDVMASQLRLLAVGASVPILTRVALMLEDLGLPNTLPPHPNEVWIRILILVGIYLIARAWHLWDLAELHRARARAAWNSLAVLLAVVVALWVVNVGLTEFPSAPAPLGAITNWSFSIRWLIFGLFASLGFVRLGAFDADPRILHTLLAFGVSVGGAFGVIVASLYAGPIAAALVTAVVLFSAVSMLRHATVPRQAEIVESGGQADPNPSGPSTLVQTRAVTRRALLEGRYRLVSPLGRGGTGRSFLAQDELENRQVVLKRLDAGPPRELLEREIRVAKRVSHPNLVAVHGLVQGPRDLYLVEEYVAGGDLARLLPSANLSAEERLRIASGLLAGLEALHTAGIVHGDLKPGNVLIGEDKTALVADFGLARLHAADAGLVGAGTPEFMPPEATAGQAASKGGDVFAAGKILEVLLAFRRTRSPRGLVPVKALPHEAKGVIRRATQETPSARYDDAGALRRAWESAWSGR